MSTDRCIAAYASTLYSLNTESQYIDSIKATPITTGVFQPTDISILIYVNLYPVPNGDQPKYNRTLNESKGIMAGGVWFEHTEHIPMFDGFQDRCNKPDSANHPKDKFWRTDDVHLSHELNAIIFGVNISPPVSQAQIPSR